jgi:hypothetical protein
MGYIQSNVTNDLVVVDRTPAAMRATLRPNEMTGSYRASLVSSTITFSNITAANGVLFTFKNTGSGLCLIRSVQIGIQIIATGFTTTARPSFSLYRVPTTFSQGTTGGTGYGAGQANALVAKKRTSMSTSAASMVIYASGAGITGDTASTEDTVQMAQVILGGTAGSVTTFPLAGLRDFFTAYNATSPGFIDQGSAITYPLTLAASEGFRIKNDAAFIGGTTGAGTAALVVTVEWDEATAY